MREKHERSERAVKPILHDILEIVEFGELPADEWSNAMAIFEETEKNSARESLLSTFRPDETIELKPMASRISMYEDVEGDDYIVEVKEEESDEEKLAMRQQLALSPSYSVIQEASESEELPTDK